MIELKLEYRALGNQNGYGSRDKRILYSEASTAREWHQ